MLGRILLTMIVLGVAWLLPREAKCESSPSMGEIKWAIYGNGKTALVASGERVLAASDFEIRKITSGQYSKRITLTAPFFFALSETGRDLGEEKGGFGLTGGRTDEKLFSWEWFNIDKPGHAVKIQENGEVNFTAHKTSFGLEIDRLDFPVDISLRTFNKADWLPINPRWRITILKGSWVRWPAVPTVHTK
jgi:hypothetical protein